MKKPLATVLPLLLVLIILGFFVSRTLKNDFDRVGSRLTAANNEIIILNAKIKKIESNLATASANSQTSRNKVKTIELEKRSLLSDLRELRADNEDLQAEMSDLRSSLAAAQQTAAGLERRTQTLRQSLQEAQGTAQRNRWAAAKNRQTALAYAEYLDILMLPFWEKADLKPRFPLMDNVVWMNELEKRAEAMDDDQLRMFIKNIEQEDIIPFFNICHYCLEIIERSLKQ